MIDDLDDLDRLEARNERRFHVFLAIIWGVIGYALAAVVLYLIPWPVYGFIVGCLGLFVFGCFACARADWERW